MINGKLSRAFPGALTLFSLSLYYLISSLLAPSALAAPSYSVGFSVDKAQAARGEQVTYSLTVTNNGDVNLTNTFVYLGTRPANATYVDGSSVRIRDGNSVSIVDAWYNDPQGTNLGRLTPNQAFTFKWKVSINSDAPQGSTQNLTLGVKTSELSDPRGFAQSFVVSVDASRSSLCSTKSVDKQTANVGDTLTFTIRVCNDGDIDQTNVLVYDKLPRELTYKAGTTTLQARGATISISDAWVGQAAGSDGTGINLGTLNSGEIFTVTYQATLNSNASNNQTIENTAQTKSDQLPNFKQCAVTFKAIVPSSPPPPPAGAPACSLTKKIRLPNGNEVTSVDAGTHVYAPNEEIIYRLFLSNPGSSEGTSFKIIDTLPTYIFWLSGDGSYDSGANKVTLDLGTLKAGESKTLTYTAKVRSEIPAGQVTQTNQVVVTYSGGSCQSSSSIVIGKPGQILAAQALPETGSFSPSMIGTLLMIGSGLALRLRKIKRHRFWNQ